MRSDSIYASASASASKTRRDSGHGGIAETWCRITSGQCSARRFVGDPECFIAANNFYRRLPSSSTQFIAANIIKKQIHLIPLRFNLNFAMQRSHIEGCELHAAEYVLPIYHALNSIYYEIRIFGWIAVGVLLEAQWYSFGKFMNFWAEKIFPCMKLKSAFYERSREAHAATSDFASGWEISHSYPLNYDDDNQALNLKCMEFFRSTKSGSFFLAFNVLHDEWKTTAVESNFSVRLRQMHMTRTNLLALHVEFEVC